MATRWKFIPPVWYNVLMNKYYLSGLIDGEGYISLVPRKRKDVKEIYFVPVVKIALTKREIIEILKKDYGGYIHKRKSSAEKNYNESWTWEVKNRKPVLAFLKQFSEHLIIKKENAYLVMEFCTFPFGFTKARYRNTYNPELIERSWEIYRRLKVLNHRGLNTSND